MTAGHPSGAYAAQGHDLVRSELEERWLARLLRSLFDAKGGGSLLDLGCGDGLAARLAGPKLERYVGVDLRPPATVVHDLRDGLGPVGPRPFDLYLGSFGIASHLAPPSLRRLLAEIAVHARRGSIVALEALGAHSLEWPRLWETPPGRPRTIPYRLGTDVPVHPWKPEELLALLEQVGIRPLRALDRTHQAGPKTDEGRYWPGLPGVRGALNALLAGGGRPREEVVAALPPLPAGPAAHFHHTLTARRRKLVEDSGLGGRELALAIWRLDPPTGGGYGHGLMVVGRVEDQAARSRGSARSSRAKAPVGHSSATA
jgi:SAM-dependent methyltransferase